jgi:hypothetical protein
LSGTSTTSSFALTLQGTGSVGFATTGAFSATSGSASSRLTQIEQVYATTGSNSFRATQSITGSLTVTGQIIAQTLNVQQVTSSIVYSSGSNTFGCDLNSRQTFTGSFYQTGSVAYFGGNVGIGTVTPSSRLHVQGVSGCDVFGTFLGGAGSTLGGIKIGNDVTPYGTLYFDNATNDVLLLQQYSSGNLRLGTNSGEKMRITSCGNVVIGNTGSYGGLTVSDFTANDGNDAISLFYRGTSGNHESLIKFYDFRGQVNASIGNNLEDDGSGTQKARLVFKTSCNGAPVERMRIAPNGFVGIGTNNPTSPLYIVAQSDSIGGDGIRLGNSAISRMWNTRFGTNSDLTYNLDFYDGAAWSNRLKLTYTGILTTPSQVSFKAYLSSNINPSKGTNVTVPYNIEEYDTQGNFSTSTYKFTAPVAGKYLFTVNFNAYSLDDTAYLRVMLLINSASVRTLFLFQNMPTGNTGDVNVSGADILNLSAGNTVEVRVYTDGSGTFGMSQALDWNSFSGHLLG